MASINTKLVKTLKNSLVNLNTIQKNLLLNNEVSAKHLTLWNRSLTNISNKKYSSLSLKQKPLLREFEDIDIEKEWKVSIENGIEADTSLREVKVGFIGGGRLGKSLCQGLLSLGDLVASVSDINRQVLRPIQELGVKVTGDNAAVVSESNVIVLSVKPHILPGVLKEIHSLVTKDHLVISVAAGVTIDTIAQALPSETRIIRIMPNTPALVQCGASVFAPGQHATEDDCDLVTKLFSSVGICEKAQEYQLDAVTGVSGSGPAYAFVAMEAMSDGGVKMGLPRELATKLAAQTLMGAAKMLLETGSHPGQLKDGVTSPGGTTITALHALEKAGFRNALIDAVEAATLKAREMGKQ